MGQFSLDVKLFISSATNVFSIDVLITTYFQKVTIKALPFYTKYFDLEYPLPKLDLIGLEDVEIGILIILDVLFIF